jgi:hypothetical protein
MVCIDAASDDRSPWRGLFLFLDVCIFYVFGYLVGVERLLI